MPAVRRVQPRANPNLPNGHPRVIHTAAHRQSLLPRRRHLPITAATQTGAALAAANRAQAAQRKEGPNPLPLHVRLNRAIAHPLAPPNNLRDNPAAPSLQRAQLQHRANHEKLHSVRHPNATLNNATHSSARLPNRVTRNNNRRGNPAAQSLLLEQLQRRANQERLHNVQRPNATPNNAA